MVTKKPARPLVVIYGGYATGWAAQSIPEVNLFELSVRTVGGKEPHAVVCAEAHYDGRIIDSIIAQLRLLLGNKFPIARVSPGELGNVQLVFIWPTEATLVRRGA